MERRGIDNLIAHWNTTLHGIELRPSAFYEMLEEESALRSLAGIQMTRVYWREGGWFSAKREYLRIIYRQLAFDICGFPICDSFAISWWLGMRERTVGALFYEIPIVGYFLEQIISPTTYFKVDSESACQIAIHGSVLRVVDILTMQNELPRLTGLAREPVFSDLYE